MPDNKIIYVTVEGGLAEVDLKTVPAGIEVRVLDFDSLQNDVSSFEEELDEQDRNYLKDQHPREFHKVQDFLLGDDEEEELEDPDFNESPFFNEEDPDEEGEEEPI